MIALLLAPVYLAFNGYVLFRLLKLLGAWFEIFKNKICKFTVGFIYAFFMLTPLLGFLVKDDPLHYALKVLGNYWLGVLQVSGIVLITFEIVRLILKFTVFRRKKVNPNSFKWVGLAAVLTITCLCIYGFTNSGDVKVNTQKISVNKPLTLNINGESRSQLKIALIADTHLGYSIGAEQMQKMVDRINEAKVDLIILAGDIFDNEYRALKNPKKIEKILSTMKSTYGAYACWGNHDIPETLLAGFTLRSEAEPYKEDPKFREFLKNSNIKLLEDESTVIDGKFYLFGRKDYSMAEKLKEKRKEVAELTAPMDKNLPIIMIDHQPRELDKARDGGVDLALSGHTHNGQVFPGNLTVKIPWENPYGVLKKGDMTSCVTSGVGVWGPAMRIGSDAEVMILDVKFKS